MQAVKAEGSAVIPSLLVISAVIAYMSYLAYLSYLLTCQVGGDTLLVIPQSPLHTYANTHLSQCDSSVGLSSLHVMTLIAACHDREASQEMVATRRRQLGRREPGEARKKGARRS